MKKMIKIILIIIIIVIIYIFGINIYVKESTKNKIIDINDLKDMKVDAIIVLGAKVHDDGRLSSMLKDRLDKTIEAFNMDVTDTILVSGDSEHNDYDETTYMHKYLIDNGIDSNNIDIDIYGLSTYDSIYRAKEVFKYKSVIIITQEYHLYRSLHIAKSLGFNAYGISSSGDNYYGQSFRELREILARNKDFIMTKFKVKSKYIDK